MNYLILKDIVKNTSSNDEGLVLFEHLKAAFLSKEVITLCVENNDSLSSSFLNTSIGLYIETYGLENFKEFVKIKGNKLQFNRLVKYVSSYKINFAH